MKHVIVAICDDDAEARGFIASRVQPIGQKLQTPLQVREYETGVQLLFSLDEPQPQPDIIFLDVMMPKYDGVEVGRALRKRGFEGVFIFLTGSDRFVFDAFDVGAYNYIVKGSDARSLERLEYVLTSAIQVMSKRRRKYILLNGITEHLSLPIESISYFEVNKHVCIVHYERNKVFELISTLGKIENMLLSYGFVRIHRSYLVNCEYVKAFTFRTCTLYDGTELPVGRSHSAKLRAAMESQASRKAGAGGAGGGDTPDGLS